MDLIDLIIAMSIPSAVTAFAFKILENKILKSKKEEEEKEQAREQHLLYIAQGVDAAIALGEATARAVQRIPDARCNGDMHAALDYAEQIKHNKKDFLNKQIIKDLH